MMQILKWLIEEKKLKSSIEVPNLYTEMAALREKVKASSLSFEQQSQLKTHLIREFLK